VRIDIYKQFIITTYCSSVGLMLQYSLSRYTEIDTYSSSEVRI
jgi:hypothetical protein